MSDHLLSSTRRKFVQYSTMLGVGAQTLLKSGDVKASIFEGKEAAGLGGPWPEMQYRTLGRTGHESSRLVFGCGATLSGGPHDDLLDAAFDAGVNTFDIGFKHYYDNAEKNLAPFLKRRRDDIFLISKAYVPTDIDWDEEITLPQAKAAGKVSHLGLSTHQNAANVLAAATKTGWFDLAMIAITPGGWYDWEDKAVLPDSPPMKDIRPLLDEARASGIGLVGMKAGRFLAGRAWLGWGNPDAFDKHYDNKLLKAKLSEFQRSYAFVLEHGLDVVNADMQSMMHLKENFVAAATSAEYFDIA